MGLNLEVPQTSHPQNLDDFISKRIIQFFFTEYKKITEQKY